MIGGPVSMLPENFRDGKNIQYISIVLSHTFAPKVGPAGTVIMSSNACLHHPCDNRRTGGRTDTCGCVKPVKANPFLGQLINIGRLN